MEEKENKKKSKKKINFKELVTDEKQRARLILGAYFIFFVVLIIAMRTSSVPVDEENQSYTGGYTEKLNMNSYEFKYTVTKGENKYIYEGKHYNNKELFNYNNNTYYKENNVYMIKKGNEYVMVDNPYVEYKYIDLVNIDKIFSKSKFITDKRDDDGSIENSYNMYIDGKITDNILKIKSKNDKLVKIEELFDDKHIILEYYNVGNVVDFNVR